MNRNTAIGLAVVALGLLFYIGFVDSKTLSTGELREQRGRLLDTFVRDRLSAFILETGTDEIAFTRSRTTDGQEWAAWKMTAPVQDEVDEAAVDALLGQLVFASARRQVGEVTSEERARFGLTDPVVSLVLTVGNRETVLRIGAEEPSGMGRYAEVESADESRISVVGKDVFESLDQRPAHFRRKELFRGYGPLRAIRVQTGEVQLERDEFREFWLIEPKRMANQNAVRSLLEGLDGLRILSFEDDEGAGREFGLGTPAGQIRFERPALEENDPPVSTELRWGAACASPEQGQVASVRARLDDGPIVCVGEEALRRLSPTRQALTEKRFFHLRSESLSSLRVDGAGPSLNLTHTDEGWYLGEHPADEQALLDWLRDLRALHFTTSAPLSGPPPATPIQLTFTDIDERTHTIRIGAQSDGTFVGIRADEPAALTFGSGLGPLLEGMQQRFQNRRLTNQDPSNAVRVRVERAVGEDEEGSLSEGIWRLNAPVNAAMDERVLDHLLRTVSSLTVDGFTDVTREGAGLTSPALTVRVDFVNTEGHNHEHEHEDLENEESSTLVLKFGSSVGENHYAELAGEPGVFLLSSTLFDSMDEPLVSRRSLAFLAIDSVVIEQPGSRHRISRTATGFETSTGVPADETRTTELLALLGTLRASSVAGYGQGIDPHIRIEVRDPDGESHTLRIEDRGTDESSLALREGLDVVFELDSSSVKTIRDWRP